MSAAHESEDPPSNARLWAPLAYRDFALLWGGYLVSHVGDSVQVHAQAWLVTDLVRSGLHLGGVALAQALPRLFLGIFSGVIVDRVDKRRLLLVTQTLAMFQSVIFLALVLTHRITYARVVVLAMLLGVFDTLNLNARMSLMPSLVPREVIGKAVALQALGVNVVQIAGPTVAALLIGWRGVSGCLFANAATFLVLLGALALMRTPPSAPRSPGKDFGGELREGFAFVKQRPAIWGAILLAYAIGLFGMPSVRLLALFARTALGVGGRGYGFLAAASGVGAMLASVFVTARAARSQLPRNIVGGALGFSVGVAALALSRSYALAFAALALVGAGQMASRSATTTLIQLETPDHMRGRVMSLLTLDFSLWSVGALLLGAFSDLMASAYVGGRAALGGRALPPDALAWGLMVTLLAAATLCLLATISLVGVICRRAETASAREQRAP